MIKLTFGFLCVLCASCATCREYPVPCTAVAIVGALVVEGISESHRSRPAQMTIQPVSCDGGACK